MGSRVGGGENGEGWGGGGNVTSRFVKESKHLGCSDSDYSV